MQELLLTFDDCAEDSPRYRATLQLVEDEVDKIQTWLEAVTKALQLFIDELNKYGEASNLLAGKVSSTSNPVPELIDSDFGSSALRTFSDSLMCVSSFQAKLVDDLNEFLLAPLLQFMREDVKQMKDQRRNYERLLEKYEFALSKYVSLSKSREVSSLREDAFQLYDLRKSYIRTSMDYTLHAIKFKYNFDRLLLNKFSDSMDSIKDFYLNSADIYRGLDSRITELKQALEKQSSFQNNRLDKLEFERKSAEERFISDSRPSILMPPMTPTAKKSVTEKQGYVFKKVIPKSAMMAPYWTRRWLYIKDGKFGFQVVSKSRGQVAAFPASNILLFEIRIDDRQDRRFTFEIISPKKSFVVQAETEEDVASWIRVFEKAKSTLMEKGIKIENDDSKPNDDEEWALEKKALLSSKVAIIDSNEAEGDSKTQKHDVLYPEQSFELKNEEMHTLCNLDKKEFYMDSYSVSLIRESSVLGRVYVTQNKLCFYAGGLNETANLQILLSDIKSIIVSKEGELQLHLGTEKYRIKVHGGEVTKLKLAIDLAAANVKSLNPDTPQELFDKIHEKYKSMANPVVKKEIPKVETTKISAISNQVAEPESEEWPEALPLPDSEVTCQCNDHLERLEHVLIFEVSASKLFNHIFKSEFFRKLHESNGDWDVKLGSWNADPMQREISWMFHVNNPMVKAKETNCDEVQTVLKKKDHLVYVAESASRTINLPYGDAFLVCSRYCITFVSKTSCKLVITTGIKWLKNPLIKSIIKVNAIKGISDFIQTVVKQLKTDFKDTKPSKEQDIVPSAANQPDTSINSPVIPTAGRKEFIMLVISLIFNIIGAFVFMSSSAPSTQIMPNFMQFSENATIYLGPDPRDYQRKKEFESYLPVSSNFHWQNSKSKSRSTVHNDMIVKSRKLKSNVVDILYSLNTLETEVVENEYVTWMMDQITACSQASKDSSGQKTIEVACKNLKYDLARFLATKRKSNQ